MKLLYLSTWDFSNEKSDGVCKKIYSQIAAFEKSGCEVDLIYIKDSKILYKEEGSIREIGTVGSIKKTPAYIKMYGKLKNKKYDWVYNRYGMMDTFYYRVLKKLHKNGARILIEIPTYPYAGERPEGILYRLMFWWDEVYQRKLKNIAERIITYSRDGEIWGIPTLRIMNGIDFDQIKPLSADRKLDDTIDLLIVALMQPHHGYERLLYGLMQYYEKGGTRKILCHFVGDGPERGFYQKIVEENSLSKYVVFYGRKGGKELEELYEKADLGVCVFGAYKQKQYWCSDLKSKEYLAKGIPVITGVETDILKLIDERYYRQFPNDDSWIDINEVIAFYDEIYKDDTAGIANSFIRKAAEQYIGMEKTIAPVIEYAQTI